VRQPTGVGKAESLVVIGLGYVGLPLALEATRAGLQVTGLDISEETVAGLNAGRSHVDDISDAEVAEMRAQGFTATADEACLAEADVAVICVPTPLSVDGGPNLAAVEAAAHAVSRHLHPRQLVVLESTTYPGTTEEVLVPILERSGLRVGTDVHCAFSPERIDPGNRVFTLRNTPKVVGGMTAECRDRATEFYSQIVDTVVQSRGVREAEMTKLLENTYRRHTTLSRLSRLSKAHPPSWKGRSLRGHHTKSRNIAHLPRPRKAVWQVVLSKGPPQRYGRERKGRIPL
jgi:nucleotide sugar dehydrogenase